MKYQNLLNDANKIEKETNNETNEHNEYHKYFSILSLNQAIMATSYVKMYYVIPDIVDVICVFHGIVIGWSDVNKLSNILIYNSHDDKICYAMVKDYNNNSTEKIVVAQFDFDEQDETQLTFREGDRIIVIEEDDSGWWVGRLEKDKNGKEGYFPETFTKMETQKLKDTVLIDDCLEMDSNIVCRYLFNFFHCKKIEYLFERIQNNHGWMGDYGRINRQARKSVSLEENIKNDNVPLIGVDSDIDRDEYDELKTNLEPANSNQAPKETRAARNSISIDDEKNSGGATQDSKPEVATHSNNNNIDAYVEQTNESDETKEKKSGAPDSVSFKLTDIFDQGGHNKDDNNGKDDVKNDDDDDDDATRAIIKLSIGIVSSDYNELSYSSIGDNVASVGCVINVDDVCTPSSFEWKGEQINDPSDNRKSGIKIVNERIDNNSNEKMSTYFMLEIDFEQKKMKLICNAMKSDSKWFECKIPSKFVSQFSRQGLKIGATIEVMNLKGYNDCFGLGFGRQ